MHPTAPHESKKSFFGSTDGKLHILTERCSEVFFARRFAPRSALSLREIFRSLAYCSLRLERCASLSLALLGVLLLAAGTAELAAAQGGSGPSGSFSEALFEDELIRNAVGNLFMLIEGAFGALIMVVSGLGAIIAAAMGSYRSALGMLVVAVGAFILRALVSLFFGSDYSGFQI